jgi:hypothetical protein
MDDSFSRALASLKGFSGFRSSTVGNHVDLEGRGVELGLFEAILTSGGDERITTDPAFGRNRYGVPPGRSADEVWFSSSTAAAISPRGYDAALQAFQRLTDAGAPALSHWFDRIRDRLLAVFGIADATVILSASGTEAELMTRVLAANLLRRPLTSVVVAPTETGSGIPLAAAGRHFLGSAPFADVPRGGLLQGVVSEADVVTIGLRDRAAAGLPSDAIDAAVAAKVEDGIAGGRDVVLHVLDCSKTGRSGPSRALASDLMRKYGDRLLVIVDSCQLRCPPEQVKADIDAGFVVMITGSKFAGGPPFAGALLLPAAIVDKLRLVELPEGIFAYTAADDWPAMLRGALNVRFPVPANIGLGLRWEAALAELEALFAFDADLRQRVVGRFADTVRHHVDSFTGFELVDRHDLNADPRQSIFPVVTLDPTGAPVAADALHRALRSPLPGDRADFRGRIYHVGQPVAVGDRSALRICLSAPQIIDVCARVRDGQDFDEAFAPLAADLNALFLKWLFINSRIDHVADELLTA